MNWPLVSHTFRQRLFLPVPLVLALCTFISCLGASIFEKNDLTQEVLPIFVPLLAWALAAGLVGREVDNGSVHLVLARPVSRSSYLLSRLAGTWLAFFSVLLASWLAALAVVALVGGSPEVGTSAAQLLRLVLAGAWWIAVLLALSTLTPGYSDVGVLLLIAIFPWALVELGKLLELRWLREIAFFFAKQVVNGVRIPDWSLSDWDWRALLRYASNVTLVLAAAFWYFNRRELGYGRD